MELGDRVVFVARPFLFCLWLSLDKNFTGGEFIVIHLIPRLNRINTSINDHRFLLSFLPVPRPLSVDYILLIVIKLPQISLSHSFFFPLHFHIWTRTILRIATTRWKITKKVDGRRNHGIGSTEWKKVRISRDLTVVDEGSKEQVRMAKPRIPRNHATNGYEKRQRAHAYRELLFGNVRVRVPSTSRRVDRVPRWYHLVEGKVEHRDRPPRTKWRFSRAFNSAYHGPPTSFLRCFDRPLIVRLPNHLSLSASLSLLLASFEFFV